MKDLNIIMLIVASIFVCPFHQHCHGFAIAGQLYIWKGMKEAGKKEAAC
jgi:hypothetical protein